MVFWKTGFLIMAVLSGCAHSGAVAKGERPEHCTCLGVHDDRSLDCWEEKQLAEWLKRHHLREESSARAGD